MPDVGDLAREQVPGRRPVRDLVVLDFALARGVVDAPAMAPFRIVLDAVGRVGDHQCGHVPGQQRLHQARISAVAAGNAMGSELPDVSRLRYRDLGDLRDFVLVGQAGSRPAKAPPPIPCR